MNEPGEAEAWAWAEWDAVETRERLEKKDVSAPEVVAAAVIRARGAKGLSAIVTPTFEQALESSKRTNDGALAGVPTFIKDLAQVAGVRTAWGSGATGDYTSPKSDPSVLAMQRAGLISLGKSATPEFGLTATTEPLTFGPTRNPWRPTHSPGGSSGGAGALVAAGVVPLAHGSDGGGSIRIPASCNGLVGLKPSRGRFDMEGSNLLPVNIAVHGVVTRSVRDTVAFWNALEPQLRAPALPPIGTVRPRPERKLHIGVFTDSPMGGVVHPDAIAAVSQAATLCTELGHQVEFIPCPVERQVIEDFLRLWGFVAFAQGTGGRILVHRDFDARQLEPGTRDFGRYFTRDIGRALVGMARLRAFTQTWARVMERFDVMISPTLAEPPPVLGHLKTDQPFELVFGRLVSYTPFTGVMNAAGAPALSLPLGRSQDGLPMGVQFAAAHGRDALLLELGLSIEAAKPWPRLAPRENWSAFKT